MLRFVVLIGVLYWGVTAAILFSIAMHFAESNGAFLPLLARSLVTFSIFGIIWGVTVWFWTEHQYRKSKRAA
jgi:hypothetical protein